MASNTENISELTLSKLKFSNWEAKEDGDNKEPTSGSHPKNTTNPIPNLQNLNPLLYDLRRPEAYERMDADKPGEELAHDATIWKLYLEEAEDHDQELVKSRHASLDMLLLFAALFSAILTAFLIESKDLLQPDPGETSAALLLSIAQSQQRIELGLPAPPATDPIDLPPFSPSTSARWINGIWFSSLALSLSAALVAMLSKEWLTAYLSSRPRPAHAHAMLRQSRIEGLERWWALHIIALLPSLLHLSLLLFSIGLVLYLWTLDVAVAAVIAGVIGLTVLFYAATAVLGAVYEFCPYVTQISSYIKAFRDTYRGSDGTNQNPNSAYTTSNDLKALMWLANNARDPAVVDCSYQALAGLRLPTGYSQSSMAGGLEDRGEKRRSGGLEYILLQSDQDFSLSSLFATVCERFTKLVRNREELSTSGWANAARYTKVLIGLGSQVRSQGIDAPLDMEKYAYDDDTPTNEVNIQITPLVMEALAVSDNLWTESAPPLHADVYAGFIASELLLLSLALPNHPPSSHFIDIPSNNSFPIQDSRPHLFGLQYTRSLARASALIWLYAERRITIGAAPLSRLLNSLYLMSDCNSLNPTRAYSHQHPRPAANGIKVTIPVNDGAYAYTAQNSSTGILASILKLMARKDPNDSELLIRVTAIEAFISLAPVILEQACDLHRSETLNELGYAPLSDGTEWDMNKTRYIGVRLAFLILRVFGSQLEAYHQLCEQALSTINILFMESNSRTEGAEPAIIDARADIIPFLECVAASDSAFSLLNRAESFCIVNLVHYNFWPGYQNLCDIILTPSCIPPVIRMVKISNIKEQAVTPLLKSVVERMRNRQAEPSTDVTSSRTETPCIEYLHRFTHVADGFFALGQIGPDRDYIEAVANATPQIVHLAVGRDSGLVVDPIELRTPAVPSFLEVVVLISNYCMEDSERYTTLLEFTTDVLDLLDVALQEEESRRIIQEHEAYSKLFISLNAIKDNDRARELLESLNRTMKELGMTIPELEQTNNLAQAEDPRSLGNGAQHDESNGHPDARESNPEDSSSDTEPDDGDRGERETKA